MVYEARKIGSVEGLGDVYQVDAPLDAQSEAFNKVRIPTLASPDEVAQIRLARLSGDFSRTSIAPIGIKGGRTILVRDSPLMNHLMASAAVVAHAQGAYFEMDKSIYEAAEARAKSQEGLAPEDRTALIVSQDGDLSLTPEMLEAQFILRQRTKPYFDKFTNGEIQFFNLNTISKKSATVNYLWFSGPQDCSWLDAGDKGLNCLGGAFGVLRSGEEAYTMADLQDFDNAMKGLEGTLHPDVLKPFAELRKKL